MNSTQTITLCRPIESPAPSQGNFLKSIFLCTEGKYRLFGVDVAFKNEKKIFFESVGVYADRNENIVLRAVKQAARTCFESEAFQILTFGYLHILVHEMGHALAYRAFSHENAKITLHKDKGGLTTFPRMPLSKRASSIISAAGPVTSMIFSSALLLTATVFRKTISLPAALLLGSGAFLWMAGEILYAQTSASHRDGGDFGRIANTSSLHLTVAKITLAVPCAIALGAAALLL